MGAAGEVAVAAAAALAGDAAAAAATLGACKYALSGRGATAVNSSDDEEELSGVKQGGATHTDKTSEPQRAAR